MKRWGNSQTQVVLFVGLAILGGACARPRPNTVRTSIQPAGRQPAIPRPQPANIRAVWVSDTSKLDWNTATAALQRAGFNTMYVNLASGGAAFYPSQILPNVSSNVGDPVAAGIRLAHQRGLAVHAKLLVTFMYKTTPEFQRKLAKTDRVMRDEHGHPIEQAGYDWLCPSQETNHTLITSIITEMLTRYPVDGLQLDYIRFNENPSCFCAHCRQAFERYLGRKVRRWPADALSSPDASRFHQWRIAVTTDWVREISSIARSLRPGLVISAAVVPELDRAREEKGQDWKTWLDRGYLNYICTMNYVPELPQFDLRNRQNLMTVGNPRQIVVGIGSWKFKQMSSLQTQINAVHQLGVRGFSLFSYDDAAERNFLPQVTAPVPR